MIEFISIGWDVRGWQGDQQAIAVARLSRDSRVVEWLTTPPPFQFKSGTIPDIADITNYGIGNAAADTSISNQQHVVAIDAPLGFPTDFRNLLAGARIDHVVPTAEIENRYAYRECERWVYMTHGKKPLSAPFDKLGNNATLAMSVASQMQRKGFIAVPQQALRADHAVIEVYPALVKCRAPRSATAIPSLARHLPTHLNAESDGDSYDAAICALLGLIFLGAGKILGLPNLIDPVEGIDRTEGWIFSLPADFVSQDQNLRS